MNELSYSCKSFTELSLAELYAILRLRQEVFIVEQTCYYLDADNLDQYSWHVIGKDYDGEIHAYARLLPVGLSYPEYGSIGRIISSMKYRGTGTGKKLLIASLRFYDTFVGSHPIKIGAQSHLLKFYNQFGFKTTGEEYLEDGIPHTAMIKSD